MYTVWFSWREFITCYAFEAALKPYKLCAKLYNDQIYKHTLVGYSIEICFGFVVFAAGVWGRGVGGGGVGAGLVCFDFPIFLNRRQMGTQNNVFPHQQPKTLTKLFGLNCVT